MNRSLTSGVTDLRQRIRRALHGDIDHGKLRSVGVRVGKGVVIQGGVWVDLEWGWLIELGDLVTLSPRVMIFAHDAAARRTIGYTRIAPVSIGTRTYVGAGTIVLPGVTVGPDCIIGAGSVVTRDIPSGSLAAGAPARVLDTTEAALERRLRSIDEGLVLGDVRADWDRPDWSTHRETLRARVVEAGEAWVK